MKAKHNAIAHQFEFWKHLGSVGNYLTQHQGFLSLTPKDMTWPSKVFNLKECELDIQLLHLAIKKGHFPKVIALEANTKLEMLLVSHGFKKTSTVQGMVLNTYTIQKTEADAHCILKVKDSKGIRQFATIASQAFGYTICENTLTSLLDDTQVALYIGKHQDTFASCGIVFNDRNGNSGLHMIGTLPDFRGLGLGKKMTRFLLNRCQEYKSQHVYLVASKLGAAIYEKLGFRHETKMVSFTIQ